MSLELQVQELLKPPLEDFGLAIVRVLIKGSQRKIVEIMIERMDQQPVKVDDCVRASREAAAFLDVEDIIKGPYVLEVTSPGLDRPLTDPKDYKRFLGQKVKIETYTALDNRRNFVGELVSADEDSFTLLLELEEGEKISFKYIDVKKAKLVPDLNF